MKNRIMVCITLPEKLKRELTELAARAGMSQSSIVERALVRYLKRLQEKLITEDA